MKRSRPVAALAALLMAVQLLAAAPSARAEADGFSRLRLTLSTTSDWARAELQGIGIRVHEMTSLTPGTQHYAKDSGWTIVPPVGASAVAVVDMVVTLPERAEPHVVVRKGMVGTATVRIDAVNGPEPQSVLEEQLSSNDRDLNERRISIDPEAVGTGDLSVPPVDPRRLTLAFYYPWFGADAPSKRSVRPDKPARPYDTADPGEVASMVDQAGDAGVDGFIVSWSGERHRNSVQLLVDAVAAQPGFVVAPLLELRAFREPNLLLGDRFDPDEAAHATRAFFDHVPASSTLEVDGRPVVFVFGMWDLSAEEWKAFLAQVADLDLFVVGDRLDRSHRTDGNYDYDPNGLNRQQLEQRARTAVDENRLRPIVDRSRPSRLWAATVSPGLDTRSTSLPLTGRWTSREAGARYDMTWDVALGAQPDWVLITSWNEWYEQTHIAPGTTSGRRALDQTARWTARF